MNIAVCIKQVPDTETKIKINENKQWINEDDINFILNPYDELAVEEGLKLKETNNGVVTIISLGPERVAASIRSALAMGADRGILLKSDEQRDSLGIAKALADEIKTQDAKIIFMGKQSVDYDNSIVGQLTAELLHYNCVPICVKLDIERKGSCKS